VSWHPKLKKPQRVCPHGVLGVKSCVDCRRALDRARYARDKAKRKALANATYAKDPERAKARSRVYKRAHPEYGREDNAKRRAALRAARCECCTRKDLRRVYLVAELVCYEVDHVIALANGGKHCCKNLQLLSPEAHREKTKHERQPHWARQ
jgi:hypothetical protein